MSLNAREVVMKRKKMRHIMLNMRLKRCSLPLPLSTREYKTKKTTTIMSMMIATNAFVEALLWSSKRKHPSDE